MDRMLHRAPNSGLTLVELLIVTSIAAIALASSAPALRATVLDNRLERDSKRLFSAINLARSESIMRNVAVSICPSAMAWTGNAVCGGTYADGWIVFTNVGKDGAVQADTDAVLRVFEGLPAGYRVTNRRGTRALSTLINYLPDGSAHRNLTLQLCPPDGGPAEPRSIVLNIVGRARLARDWGTCPESP